MTQEQTANQKFSDKDLADAQASLAKLPILGPAMWLFAKDPAHKFMFVGDLDFRLLPPIVLDHCRLFTRNEIPWGFFTWARVSDEVHARLQSGVAKLAPHEWNSGTHIWLVDQVAPFGGLNELIDDLRQNQFTGEVVYAVPSTIGQATPRSWPPVAPAQPKQ